jgi:hypothetical protein
LPLDEALRIATQIAHALDAALNNSTGGGRQLVACGDCWGAV